MTPKEAAEIIASMSGKRYYTAQELIDLPKEIDFAPQIAKRYLEAIELLNRIYQLPDYSIPESLVNEIGKLLND